ncbi:hypothetical protein Tco_1114234 [Tanacetum coccineum]|uniref:Xylulose kinase-1 n=1 Tax=Tanacetum coccineum TaxID=301880 RepID=A0ABQ5IUH5_9ASTR
MPSPKFAEMHNVVAFLEKPRESDGFAEIIDFLKASSVHYALIVNPTIYTSCIEQFWATTKGKTVNDVRQIQALIDKKKLIITETSIRSDLHLEDAGASEEVGEDSNHPTDSNQIPIIDQPSTSSPPKKKQKSKRKQRKEAEVAYDETGHEESVLDLENAKSDQAIEIAKLKKREDKLENRRNLGAQEDASNRGGELKILMQMLRVLDGDEMFVDATTGEKDEHSTKIK